MIQFNLLPDVKVAFIKARRMKRLVTLVSLGLSALSIFVLLLSITTVYVVQKKSLNDLNRDIDSRSKQLKAIPQLDKILTVQNQLNTLETLHGQKVASSRVFDYISEVTPNGVTLTNSNVDFSAFTFTFIGNAKSLDQVNQLVDTLKSTTYVAYTPDAAGQKQQADDQQYFKDNGHYPSTQTGVKKAFSSVVLASFGKDDKGANYTISFAFDPLIFSNTNLVSLQVPSDSITNTSVLFQKAGV